MDDANEDKGEDFVHHPGKNDEDDSAAPLPTYTSLLASAPSEQPSTSSLLFSQYTFYLSRETSSRTWEFVIRAFGGRVVTSLEGDQADGVTHVLIDRPVDAARMRAMEAGRKWTWVQPQWAADCVNARQILPSGPGSGYEPGATLPPHLSPWAGEGEVQRPWLDNEQAAAVKANAAAEAEEVDEEEEEDEAEEKSAGVKEALPPALLAAAQDPTNEELLHAAELEAEADATPHAAFRTQLKKATAAAAKAAPPAAKPNQEEDLRKIMMTGKKQKLYNKMQYSNNERKAEVSFARVLPRCVFADMLFSCLTARQAGGEEAEHSEAESKGGQKQGCPRLDVAGSPLLLPFLIVSLLVLDCSACVIGFGFLHLCPVSPPSLLPELRAPLRFS